MAGRHASCTPSLLPALRYKGYWTIAILDIELTYPAGEVVKTGVCARRPRKICRAIVDTGTYLVYGPRR